MKRIKGPTLIYMSIGVLSLLAGIYFAFSGAKFMGYFMPIFLGVTLVGTAYINAPNSDESGE